MPDKRELEAHLHQVFNCQACARVPSLEGQMCRHVRDATFSEVGANPPADTVGDGPSRSTTDSKIDLDWFDVSGAVAKGKSV
jgi:hypothetical protein